ncbi:MAG: 4'-phosphopantetheinyl transferase superfamily protein [Solirubrobacteraceae bacterium]
MSARIQADGEAPVTVWWAWCSRARPLDEDSLSSLSPRERARVDRLHRDDDRERSALGRVLLRAALGRRLGVDPGSVELDWEHGPSLDPRHGVWASMAHSRDGVTVAVSTAGPVGVDLESFERAHDLHRQVRERVFTQRERDDLAALPQERRGVAAVELWTVKEAVLKAAGGRLVHPPASVEVHRNGGPPRLVGFEQRRDLIDGARLSVLQPPEGADPGYVATVAVIGAAGDGDFEVASYDGAALLR